MTEELGRAVLVLDADDKLLRTKMAASALAAEKQLAASGARLKRAGTSMVTTGRTMTRSVTLPVVAAGAAVVKLGMDYETTMNRMVGLAGIAREEVAGLSEEVLKMAPEVAKSPQELAEGLFFIASAGFSGAEAMTVLRHSARASAAGLGEVQVVADAVTSAVGAYGIENLGAAEATDTLTAAVRVGKLEADALAPAISRPIPLAAALGVEFNEVAAAMAAMSRTGTDASTAATQTRAILSGLVKPTSDAEEMMEKLGLSAQGLRDQLREKGLLSVLQTMMDRTKGNETAMARLFPNIRALTGVLDLLGGNVKGNVDLFKEMEDVTGSTDHAFKAVSETTEFDLNKELAKLHAQVIRVGEHGMPIMVGAAKILLGGVVALVGAFASLPAPVSKGVLAFAVLAAAAGPLIFVFGRLFQAVGSMMIGLSKFIGFMRLLPTMIGVAILNLTALTASLGVLKGVLVATGLVMRAHPIMAIATGVAVAGAAVWGLAKAFGGLFDEEEDIPELQKRLTRTSDAMVEAMKRQKAAVEGLRNASKRVREAREDERKASDRVKRAEDRLARVREKYPAKALPVVEAEARVAMAKNRSRRATNRLRNAERLHGVELKAAKVTMRQNIRVANDRVEVTRDQVKQDRRAFRQAQKNNFSDEQQAKLADKLIESIGVMNKAQGERSTILQDAARQVNPKFAKSLERMKTTEDFLLKKQKQLEKHTKNPFKNTILDATQFTRGWGRQTDNLGNDFVDTRKKADKSLDLMMGELEGTLGTLGVKKTNFGIKKKAQGGLAGIVPGGGSGDNHLLSIDGVPQAKVESKEGVFVGNRSLMERLGYLNSVVPRRAHGGYVDLWGTGMAALQAGGGLNFALGPHDIPPIQYAADHAGGNSHVHITGTTTPWVVAIGQALQRMGMMVSEHPAFGGVNFQHSATGGHYDALAIDVNTASDETPGEVAAIAKLLGGKGGLVGGMGAIAQLTKYLITGPAGALRTAVQRVADIGVDAGNKYLSRQTAKMGVDSHSGAYGGQYGKPELMKLWRGAGGPAGVANLAAAVALAESGGDPNASNQNTNGSIDRGLWQINSIHGKLSTFNPAANAAAAVRISGGGRDWSPWVAFNSGAHQQYLKMGGQLGPYIGRFDKGGVASRTGFAHVERGESIGQEIVININGDGAALLEDLIDEIDAQIGDREASIATYVNKELGRGRSRAAKRPGQAGRTLR